MTERDFKGVWIPKEIWLNSALNITDKAVLIEIDSLDNGEDGCWAGNKHFAEMLGCTERQASASIAKLVNMGYVKVLRFDGRNRFLRSCLKEKVCEADTKDASSSITEPSGQPDENFYAASPKLPHSNPMSNTKRNPMKNINESAEESAGACEEVDPFGEDGPRLNTDTIQAYAANNLTVLSARAMEELNGFVDDLSEDIVRHAIDNALDQGVRKWAYVKSILMDYVNEGVRSVAEAKTCDEKHRRKRKGGGSGPGFDRTTSDGYVPLGANDRML